MTSRTWYCSLWDKNLTVDSETGHIRCTFYKRREQFAFTVEKYEFDSPEITQMDKTLKYVINDCKDNCFHTIVYRFEYNIKI